MKYLRLDIVSTLFLLATIFLFIMHFAAGWNVSGFLGLVALFVFRGIMWQKQYVQRIRDLEEENDCLRDELKK